ncbi:MAG: hypothetical protein V2A73_23160 [Pseudomonadota bacterium]
MKKRESGIWATGLSWGACISLSCLGCQEASSDPDAHHDSAPDAAIDERCVFPEFNEASCIVVTYREQSEYPEQPPIVWSRQFTVGERGDRYPGTETYLCWSDNFLGKTEENADAKLIFSLPYDKDKDGDNTLFATIGIGDVLLLKWTLQVTSCLSGQDAPGIAREPRTLNETELRSKEGELLLLYVEAAPLADNGVVLLEPTLTPEISVSWKNLGCPSTPNRSGTPSGEIPVEIRVSAKASGEEAAATFGHRDSLTIGGSRYVLAVARAFVHEKADGCGHTKWLLYREDLFVPGRYPFQDEAAGQ